VPDLLEKKLSAISRQLSVKAAGLIKLRAEG
jgi:hypothetical protein